MIVSNRSTGELGLELCKALIRKKIKVALVTGPTAQPFDRLALSKYSAVETHHEMQCDVLRFCKTFKPDFAIFAAAVLDFAPERVLEGKLSSARNDWKITLKPTPKIIDEVHRSFPWVRKIGFKMEWQRQGEDVDSFARSYLEKKQVELLCLNFLSEIKNKKHPAYLYSKTGRERIAKTKSEIASWIAQYIINN